MALLGVHTRGFSFGRPLGLRPCALSKLATLVQPIDYVQHRITYTYSTVGSGLLLCRIALNPYQLVAHLVERSPRLQSVVG